MVAVRLWLGLFQNGFSTWGLFSGVLFWGGCLLRGGGIPCGFFSRKLPTTNGETRYHKKVVPTRRENKLSHISRPVDLLFDTQLVLSTWVMVSISRSIYHTYFIYVLAGTDTTLCISEAYVLCVPERVRSSPNTVSGIIHVSVSHETTSAGKPDRHLRYLTKQTR